MAARKVLITGSAGHLGRALRAAFEDIGDKVTGIDLKDAEINCDLDFVEKIILPDNYDVVICNAKVEEWSAHHALVTSAKMCAVNIGSIYGTLGSDARLYKDTSVEQTPEWYVASKGAMVALTRHQATTLAPVRVNCVCPGGIERGQGRAFVDRYSWRVPLNRMATEDDIVGPVLFLCSDAARYITGQVLMVDGGLSAW